MGFLMFMITKLLSSEVLTDGWGSARNENPSLGGRRHRVKTAERTFPGSSHFLVCQETRATEHPRGKESQDCWQLPLPKGPHAKTEITAYPFPQILKWFLPSMG